MTSCESDFLTIACETLDAQENESLFIGSVDPLLVALSHKGMTEKQVWECQLSLKRAGFIRLFANFNVEPVDPTWSRAAPEFAITSVGLRWWLIRKHGQAEYSKMVSDIKRTKNESERNGIMFPVWVDQLQLPLLLVQRILHAEGLAVNIHVDE
jgi:hypothetical protein